MCDPSRSMKRMLGIPGQAISAKAYSGARGFDWKFPSLHAPFCCPLILGVLLFMVSGCGKYKEELESAKQQIEKLNSEVKRLTEDVARLNQEKSRLSEESKTLSDKNTRMQRELDDLNKAKTALTAENKEIRQKNIVAEHEIASLKKEKAESTKEVGQLKKRVAEMAPLESSTAIPTELSRPSQKEPGKLSPCDALVAFMQASQEVARRQRGTERARSLEQVKQQYAPRMKEAPEKAIKAAENWVKELTKSFDQIQDDSVFRLIQLRNTVLEACGKSANEAGF